MTEGINKKEMNILPLEKPNKADIPASRPQ